MSLGAHSSRVEQTRVHVYTGLNSHFSHGTDGRKGFVGYTKLTGLEPEDIAATIAKRDFPNQKEKKKTPAVLRYCSMLKKRG
jgi:hypothetical protein